MSRNFLVVKICTTTIKLRKLQRSIYTMSKIESNSTVYNGKLVLFLQNKKQLCITNDAKEINCILIKYNYLVNRLK